MNTINLYRKAFESFAQNRQDVKRAFNWATSQSSSGDSTSHLELFPDGEYRVLPQPGNLYISTGILHYIRGLRADEQAYTIYRRDNVEIGSAEYYDLDEDEQAKWTEFEFEAEYDDALDRLRDEIEQEVCYDD